MRDYELTVLLAPELAEKELDKEMKQLCSLLEKVGAKIKSKTDPAKRSLAYEIGNCREANYVFFELAMEPEKAIDTESKIKLDGAVIRYLLVRSGS